MFSAPLIDVIVPFHAAGVDRNKHYYDETMLYKVPLHAEGVDRNLSGNAEREKRSFRASLNRGQVKTTAQNCLQAVKEERANALSSLIIPDASFSFCKQTCR